MGPLGEPERHVMDTVWGQAPATVREVSEPMRDPALVAPGEGAIWYPSHPA